MQFIGSHHLIGSLPGAEAPDSLESFREAESKQPLNPFQDKSWQHQDGQDPLLASLVLLSLAMLSLAFALLTIGT